MANVPAPEFQKLWTNHIECLRRECQDAIQKYPDTAGVMERVHRVLVDIARLAGCTPISVGQRPKWDEIVKTAAETSRNLHQLLVGKPLYSALQGVYAQVLIDLKGVLQESAAKGDAAFTSVSGTEGNEFREQRRRKRNYSEIPENKSKKPTTALNDPRLRRQQEIPTRNFFDILRTTEMEKSQSDAADHSTTNQQELTPTNRTGRPPPIVLTSQVNLIEIQKRLKSVTKGDLELRSTKNGTRVVTKEMADFSATKSHSDTQNLQYFIFYPKFQKPIKAVILLPPNTPAEDISDGLVDLGYGVISV
jgi:hypothetical protein